MTTVRSNASREGLLARQSRPASVHSLASIDTLVAGGENDSRSYRGFRSREAYLEALRNFAESKMYLENDYQLDGFYGHKTMDFYKNKPGLRAGRSKRGGSSSSGTEQASRRATVAHEIPESVAEESQEHISRIPSHNSARSGASRQDSQLPKESRARRLSRVFAGGRRATVV